MREILFRAKRTDNGEWVEGSYFPKTSTIAIEDEKIKGIIKYKYFMISPETVGQYTGLTDKNGKRTIIMLPTLLR